jgi:hypothetical protein
MIHGTVGVGIDDLVHALVHIGHRVQRNEVLRNRRTRVQGPS